jgi:hypothetical protein
MLIEENGMKRSILLIAFALLAGGCDSEESTVVSTQTSGEVCDDARLVEVGVWGTGGDCDGDPSFVLTVKFEKSCFGWERSLEDGSTRWNSATNLRCHRDRVCFTQHPDAETCGAPIGTTDKEWSTSCQAGTKILSGTENCPDAPSAGCPLSDTQEGSGSLECDGN